MHDTADTLTTGMRARIDARILTTLDETAQAISPAGIAGTEMVEVLRASARGGKRLRALLTVGSHAANGGRYEDEAVTVAAALEWFQTAALIHDDVLDGSDLRRGEPAAHRRFESLYSDVGAEHSAEELGRAAGILAGDVALMISHRALDSAIADLPARREVASLFASMAELVTAGQYLDMRIASAPLSALEGQRDDIMATMRSKTASYSAEGPLALGAAVAGADSSRIESMRHIGVPLGVAFQLRDDVLGLVGSPETTGKPAGDDIREGKRTILLWHAWTHGSHAHRAAIGAALGDRQAPQSQIDAAVEAVIDAGGVDAAEEEIALLVEPALVELDTLDLAPEGAAVLRDLAVRLTSRSA
ncbi:polyprenyl synthetase family protein [Demequina zhanjiangensis]|uniref:Polyprenyl synthetase family protein n=1 Tax=Demequina zhanjiangensis TaxID=3051659 RepID=A0ABT8G0N8_9MICO|nr:polyprenyl synthetase family protein [Demequina sp. SYSU T00b26]MDN4472700.1 polyprenyl synthetase family protein [Demequina sp. SYSU T00b26]